MAYNITIEERIHMDTKKDIATFKNNLSKMSMDELVDERNQLNDEISKMILNSDLIMKVAIIEEYIKFKLEESEKENGKTI